MEKLQMKSFDAIIYIANNVCMQIKFLEMRQSYSLSQ